MKTKQPIEAEILHDPTPERYSIIDNKLIEHPTLPYDSKAVAIYLLSRPKDWKIQRSDVERFMNSGREKRQRVFKDLVEAGYMSIINDQNKAGQWRTRYQLHRNPKKTK
jgi:hypothetical protein